MSSDDLSLAENRIAAGIDHLLRSAGAWATAADATERRTRTALGRVIGGTTAGGFAGGVAYGLGPIAWCTTGGLLALSVWVAGAPPTDDDANDEPGPDDDEQLLDADLFAEFVHLVARGGNVHLSAIGAQLAAETGRVWDVLALCRQHGIPTRPVRVPGADPAVTTGIHRTDLPPLPQPLSEGADGVVYAGQPDNNNTTITSIGEGAAVIVKHGSSIRQGVRR